MGLKLLRLKFKQGLLSGSNIDTKYIIFPELTISNYLTVQKVFISLFHSFNFLYYELCKEIFHKISSYIYTTQQVF